MGPTKIVATRLPCEPSSSSQVTISRLLWLCDHDTYEERLFCSQVSPWATVPLCMSSFRFGMTHATVGSATLLKSFANLVNGRLLRAGRSVKFVHGECFRAYAPYVQTSEPFFGRPSE